MIVRETILWSNNNLMVEYMNITNKICSGLSQVQATGREPKISKQHNLLFYVRKILRIVRTLEEPSPDRSYKLMPNT